MRASAHKDTSPSAIVKLTGVQKTFRQRQNTQSPLKNLFRPSYKYIHALDHVDLSIHKGEFVAYAGPNGAGKSTTFRLICGMLAPNEGRVEVFGQDPMRQRIPLMHKMGVLFGNRTELWYDHPVISSYKWKKSMWNIPTERYETMLRTVTDMLDLGPILNTFVRELSLGQRMRADLGMLLLHEPELILLDEPTLGLDVLAKRQMIEFLKTLNDEMGVTILVTSHDMDDLTEMAKRIIMVSNGKPVYDGDLAQLRQLAGVQRTVTLTAAGPVPVIPGAQYHSSDENRHTFHFDQKEISVSAMLKRIADIPKVQDVELGYPPIEEMIADLYKAWKGSD